MENYNSHRPETKEQKRQTHIKDKHWSKTEQELQPNKDLWSKPDGKERGERCKKRERRKLPALVLWDILSASDSPPVRNPDMFKKDEFIHTP